MIQYCYTYNCNDKAIDFFQLDDFIFAKCKKCTKYVPVKNFKKIKLKQFLLIKNSRILL